MLQSRARATSRAPERDRLAAGLRRHRPVRRRFESARMGGAPAARSAGAGRGTAPLRAPRPPGREGSSRARQHRADLERCAQPRRERRPLQGAHAGARAAQPGRSSRRQPAALGAAALAAPQGQDAGDGRRQRHASSRWKKRSSTRSSSRSKARTSSTSAGSRAGRAQSRSAPARSASGSSRW